MSNANFVNNMGSKGENNIIQYLGFHCSICFFPILDPLLALQEGAVEPKAPDATSAPTKLFKYSHLFVLTKMSF